MVTKSRAGAVWGLEWLEHVRRRSPRWCELGEIEDRFRATRSDVLDHVRTLQVLSVRVDVDPCLGVRWVEGPEPLSSTRILRALNRMAPPAAVRVYLSVGSTSDILCEWARAGADPGSVVFAEHQTSGRGRRGRSWHSPAFQGLWFSCFLGSAIPDRQSPCYLAAATVAIAGVLRRDLEAPARIRWPNDLFVSERKVGGCLLEHRHPAGWILGVGLNCNCPMEDLDRVPGLAGVATSLMAVTGDPVDRSRLAGRLLSAIGREVGRIRDGRVSSVVDRWVRYSDTVGRPVRVLAGRRRHDGIVKAVDPTGGIAVAGGDGRVRWYREAEVERVEVPEPCR